MQRTRNVLAIPLLIALVAAYFWALNRTSGIWWLMVLFGGPFIAFWLTDKITLRVAYWWHHGPLSRGTGR